MRFCGFPRILHLLCLSACLALSLPSASAQDAADSIHYHTRSGIQAIYSGRTAEAVGHMEWVYDYVMEHHLMEHVYNASINYADVLLGAGRYVESAEILRHGLLLCDSLSLAQTLKVPFYNMLSQIYCKFGDYGTALSYSDTALPLVPGASLMDRSNYWNTRGNILYLARSYDEARQCFTYSVSATADSASLRYNYYVALLNLQDIALRQGDYDGVEQRLDECSSYFGERGIGNAVNYAHTLRAVLSMERDHDLRQAGRWLAEPPVENSDETLASIRREALYNYYTQTGQKDSVIAVLLAECRQQDTLLASVAAMRVTDAELQFRESLREHEIIHTKSRLRNFIFFTSLFAVFIFALVLLWFFWQRSRAKVRALQVRQLETDLWHERLHSLRQRISPHYLMNLLTLLRQDGGEDRAGRIAMTLRESLVLSERVGVTLDEECRFVDSFFALLPASQGFRLVWDVAPDVQPEACTVPSMCVQLPVENAVKYAYPEGWEGSREVRIRVARQCIQGVEGLAIVVEDDGVGLQQATMTTAMGNSILTRTFSILNLHNRHQIDMHIADRARLGEGSGVRVEYFIPADISYEFQ